LDTKRKIILTATAAIIATILIATYSITALNPALTADLESYTAQAQKIFNQAKSEMQRLRNITITQDVTLYVITKQDAVDRWGTPAADANLVNIRRQENLYKSLGMMAENDSLYEATVEWTANWGAATLPGAIYVIKENFDPWNLPDAEGTFVHELTHIWEPSLNNPTTFDMDKAHAALVEGDASYMGDYFKAHYTPSASPANGISSFLIDNPALSAIHQMPQTVTDLNWFPYVQGKDFVVALYNKDGWPTVNQAYVRGYTPDTTEQILHPDKYFANESAQEVSAPTLAENNWNLIQSDHGMNYNTYGEYFIQVMLGNWLSESDAQRASAGWAGDNFTYYERGSEYLFTWNIKWDTQCDASDFYVTFHVMMNATGAAGDESCHWTANGRYILIEWDQNTNTTLIAVSNNQAAAQESYFK
jgi:hypothetical protein